MDGLDGADGTVLVGALVERHFCGYRTKVKEEGLE